MEIYDGQFIYRQIIITSYYVLCSQCCVDEDDWSQRSNIKEKPPGLLYNCAFIIIVMSAFCFLVKLKQINFMSLNNHSLFCETRLGLFILHIVKEGSDWHHN